MSKTKGNAKIGNIEKKIEKEFGLPKGCISIRNTDGTNCKSQKLIKNLRKDYGEE